MRAPFLYFCDIISYMGKESTPTKAEPQKEKKKRLWQVTFDQKGNLLGLPKGVSRKDVIVFIGKDGKWWAENPSPEILEERQMWRSD